jgi:hypothetical protein
VAGSQEDSTEAPSSLFLVDVSHKGTDTRSREESFLTDYNFSYFVSSCDAQDYLDSLIVPESTIPAHHEGLAFKGTSL